MNFSMREYFQITADFDETYNKNNDKKKTADGVKTSGDGKKKTTEDGKTEEEVNSKNSSGKSGKSSSYSVTGAGDFTLWKFLGFDKLTDNQMSCLEEKSDTALSCVNKCNKSLCKDKCSTNFISNIKGCLKAEEPEEEETVEETIEEVEEADLEVNSRFMFNHLNNISTEGSYVGDSYARFTPIEGDAYTIDIQGPIYPNLAVKLLNKTRGMRGEYIERREHDSISEQCRFEGGLMRGGNQANDC